MAKVENIQSQGYHGGFLSDIPELQLQHVQRILLILIFHWKRKAMKADKAVINLEIEQSFGPEIITLIICMVAIVI